MSIVLERPMGRPKGSRDKNKPVRDDVAVKVDRTVIGKAKLIATHRGITLAELLSTLLRAPVDKEYAKMLRELDRAEKGGES